jgi:two-component system CheB/CheR fusion protein
VGRCAYGEIDAAGEVVTVHRDYHAADLPSVAGRYRIADYGTETLRTLRRGQTFFLEDVRRDPLYSDAETQGRYTAMRVRAAVVVPLVKSGRLVALLTLQQNAPRAWSASDLRLIEEVAERTWAAVGQARAEAELRASEARLSEAFKIQTVGVLFWDEGFGLADTNEAFLRMTGFTREEALGKTWQELTPPEFHAASWKAVREITDLGETRPYEKQYFRKDGSRWWGLFAARKVGEEVVEYVLDVTARKEAEERISDSEGRLHAIFEGASVGLSEIDASGRLVRVNDELGRILGRSRLQLLGMSIADVTHPDDLPASLAMVEGVMSGRIGGRESGVDKRYLRPDGSIVWAHSSGTLLSGNGKGPGSLLIVTVDLTERRAAEAAMRESEERFRQFGDASSDALWIRDEGTLEWEYLSPAFDRIYGIRREDALASRSIGFLMDLVHPDDREATHAAIRELRDRPRSYEYRIRRPSDGKVRWLRTTGFRLFDPDGRVQRLGGITYDATEERQTADRMEVLLAELQHRTRNIVGVVQSMASRTLKRSASLEDFGNRFGERLEALARVNGLLSRLDEGDRVTFDDLVAAELQGHGVLDEEGYGPQVEVIGPRGIGLPSASVQTLALALHELLTNAAKYGALSSPKGRLCVTWEVVTGDPPSLRFEWRETGIVVEDVDLAPRKRGYGRELIERALPYQLGAETTYELEPDGLRCVVLLPLPERRRRRDHEQ